jgi:hypothetical protein
MGLLRRGEEVESVTSLQDTARGHMPLQIPFPSRSGEIVVDDATGARAGVENAIVPYVDRYVVDLCARARKQKQVARLK